MVRSPLNTRSDRPSQFPTLASLIAENGCMSRRNFEYWGCQISGWCIFSAIGLTTAVMENGWRPSAVIGYTFFFFYSIGLTHWLRREIRHRAWTTLPLF